MTTDEHSLLESQKSGTIKDGKQKLFCYFVILLASISLVLSLITIFFVISNGFHMTSGYTDHNCTATDRNEPNILCVPCEEIETGGEVTPHVYHSLKKTNDKNGVIKCCTNNAFEAKSITKSMKSGLTRAVAVGSSDLAFAQKSLMREQEEYPDSKSTVSFLKLDPQRHDPTHEVVHGVNTTYNGLQIVTEGLYFVYKNLNFLPDTIESCKSLKNEIFRSAIIKKYPGSKDNTLLVSEHKCCFDCQQQSETGFVGGMFVLKEGDLIEVEVSGLNHISLSRDVTYMGVFMLKQEA